MMNIVEHVCLDQGKPTMVISCEMTQRQLVQRLTYGRARYDASQLSRGIQPTKGELMKFQTAIQAVKDDPEYRMP